MHLVSQSPEDTRAIAARFAVQWKDSLRGRRAALVVGLEGELGAGKTAFVQGVADALGIREIPRSPTFALVKTYNIPGSTYQLCHLDCYRLEGRDDLRSLDVPALFANPNNLVIVEWADRIGHALPADHIIIRMSHEGEAKRSLSFNDHPTRS